jgi:molybdenum cofactor biosynthesis enzyme MoaA
LYCPYIEKGLTIKNHGAMVPCCAFKGDLGLNIASSSIGDYFESPQVDELKDSFKNDVWPSGCTDCKLKEDSKKISLRVNAIPQKDLFEKWYLDINVGNECNSDCVMCTPGDSSKILTRIKKHGVIDQVEYDLGFSKNSWANGDLFWNDIQKNITNISCIKFLGGEPFLIKSIWKYLDQQIVQEHKHNIILQITTNASVLTKNISILDGWKRLLINVSADATGEQFEWVRQGLLWPVIVENVKTLNSLQNSTVSVSVVISAYTVTGIVDMLNWINENTYLIHLINLNRPAYMALNYAPVDVLQTVLLNLDNLKMKTIQNQIQLVSLRNYLKDAILENKHNPMQLKSITNYFNNHRTHTMNPETLEVTKK